MAVPPGRRLFRIKCAAGSVDNPLVGDGNRLQMVHGVARSTGKSARRGKGLIIARQSAVILVVVALGIWGGGCSSISESPSWTMPDAPKLPSLDSVAALTAPAEAPPKGSATELYTKVARGAVGCWFGATGPLKKDYIYNAEADAPSRGGKAEITIHNRDASQPNPRGPKAYLIKIDPKDESNATIATENLKMPEPMAEIMAADVNRWSRGDTGCAGTSTAANWSPQVPILAPAAAKPAVVKPKSSPMKKKVSAPQGKPAAPPVAPGVAPQRHPRAPHELGDLQTW